MEGAGEGLEFVLNGGAIIFMILCALVYFGVSVVTSKYMSPSQTKKYGPLVNFILTLAIFSIAFWGFAG